MLYNRNLEALRMRHKDIYDYIVSKNNTGESESLTIESAKNGEPVVVLNRYDRRYYLNSRYNPSHETDVFVKQFVNMPDQSILVMFGLSTGIFASRFLESAKHDVTCIVYEPDAEILEKVLQQVDIEKLLMDKRFILVVHGIKEGDLSWKLSDRLSVGNMKTNRYVECPGYKELYKEEHKRYSQLIYEANLTEQTRINTYAALGDRMVYTGIQNLRFLPGCRSAMDYMGLFPADMPAIIVSAGPSLQKNVHLLKEAKGKALIIAVDHALPMLESRGIVPDIVICVDNKKSPALFDVPGIQDITFFAESCMNTEVLESIRSKQLVFYSASTEVWGNLFEQAESEICTVFSGGSVAIEALSVLIMYKFHRIILIGQDLALEDGRYYADETDEEKKEYDIRMVKGINGGSVATTREFIMFKACFENLASVYSDIQIIDATEGGALIENTIVMTLQEAIDRYCTTEYDIADILHRPRRLFLGKDEALIAHAYKKIKEHMAEYKEVFHQASEAGKQGSMLMSNGQYDKNMLRDINRRIQKADETYSMADENLILKRCVGFEEYQLFTDLYQKEQKDEEKEAIRLYKKCESFFGALSDATTKITAIVEDAEAKMKLHNV